MDSREVKPEGPRDVKGLQPQMQEDRFSIAGMLMGRVHRYKILLKKYHPDLSGSAENERVSYTEKTTRVTDAYRKIIRWYSTGKID